MRDAFRIGIEEAYFLVDAVNKSVIEDSRYVWWAVRPSLTHPTLELRAPDSCA
jgi:carboxylate-amine ligase